MLEETKSNISDADKCVESSLQTAKTETLLLQLQIAVLTPLKITNTLLLDDRAQQILDLPDSIPLDKWINNLEPAEYRSMISKVELEGLQVAIPHADGRYIRAKLWQYMGITGEWQIAIQFEPNAHSEKNPLDTDYFAQQQLLSIISHELRTPAATLRMLIDELDPKTDLNVQLPLLKQTSERLMSVLQDMRQAINPEQNLPFTSSRFHPNRLIENVAAQMRRVAESHDITIRMGLISDESLAVETDVERCKLLLLNLLKNAIYHSHGHEICVSVELGSMVNDRAPMTLTVQDDGIGIAPDRLERLLQPFQRESSLTKGGNGTGLGLFVTQQTLAELNSKLQISHPQKGGLKMYCTIDCLCSVDRTVSPTQVSQESKSFQNRLASMKVLVVEDDPVIRMVSQRLLSKRVGEVDVAENGALGLEKLKTNQYDLILTDYYMPVMDGLEMIKEARILGIKTPIVSVTAAVLGKETAALRKAGADQILAKPISMKAFIDTVQSLFF